MEFIKVKLKELFNLLKNEFIPEQKKRLKIFKYRPRLIIFFVILLIVSISIDFKGYGVGIYLVLPTPITILILLLISISNLAECIFRRIEDVRHVATMKEKQYLLPIFKNTYTAVKEKYPNLSDKIKLYIVDTMNIESFLLGKTTVVLSRGIVETMSEEELKGVLAHELGHITLYHSQIKMMIVVMFGTVFWLCIFIEKLLNKILSTMRHDNIISVLLRIARIPFFFVVNMVFLISNMIIIPNYRKNEYKADNIAVECGFGLQIKEALYKIYDMEITDKKELLNRIYDDHPRTAYRIEEIEKVIN